MSDDDAGKRRHALATAMLDMTDQIAPIVDTADGMKADLERRGWSPTAAEQVALQWLVGAMAAMWRTAA